MRGSSSVRRIASVMPTALLATILGMVALAGTASGSTGPPSNLCEAVHGLLAKLVVQQKLTAADAAARDVFGSAVAISGDTVVVGALDDDVGDNTDQGSAYVFVRSGTTWTQQAKLTAADGAAWDGFGNSVAVSGDTAVVGACVDDVGANAYQGSAYVFVRGGTTWTQQAKLVDRNGAAHLFFGSSVAISGGTIAVGAVPLREWMTPGIYQGQSSAYVFERSGTTWSQQQWLTAADGCFGQSVAISGDTLVVGAWADDVGANAFQGSAYVFERSGTIWSQRQWLTAADGAARDGFGCSVAISGDTAVVGAPTENIRGKRDRGATYVFAGVTGAPDTPVARSPTQRIRSDTPVFRWSLTGGAATYEVRVFGGSRLIASKSGIARTHWRCSQRLPRGVWLTWKVRGRNAIGWGPWSNRPLFKVQ
jgi:hypothetical protein